MFRRIAIFRPTYKTLFKLQKFIQLPPPNTYSPCREHQEESHLGKYARTKNVNSQHNPLNENIRITGQPKHKITIVNGSTKTTSAKLAQQGVIPPRTNRSPPPTNHLQLLNSHT
jgi:hypothetical protein